MNYSRNLPKISSATARKYGGSGLGVAISRTPIK
jgi:signal transduction histidine kinase